MSPLEDIAPLFSEDEFDTTKNTLSVTISSPSLAQLHDKLRTHTCTARTEKERWFCNVSIYLEGLYWNELEKTEIKALIAANNPDFNQDSIKAANKALDQNFFEITRDYMIYIGPNIDIQSYVSIYWEFIDCRYTQSFCKCELPAKQEEYDKTTARIKDLMEQMKVYISSYDLIT